jgi:hypothetical protein
MSVMSINFNFLPFHDKLIHNTTVVSSFIAKNRVRGSFIFNQLALKGKPTFINTFQTTAHERGASYCLPFDLLLTEQQQQQPIDKG